MGQNNIQNAANHTHIPTMAQVAGLPALVGFILLGIGLFREPTMQNAALVCVALSVLVLVLISRAYTVRLQDRIIRLEMRLRLERLGRVQDFHRLSTGQLIALRFGSDAELPALIERTLAEGLTPKQIKNAVADWQPDFHRT